MGSGSPNRTITVKLGGSAMDDDDVVHQLAEDISSFSPAKTRFIIVHGGGKAISRETEARGIKTTKVSGLRITDDATMQVVEAVMSKTNDAICDILKGHGMNAQKVLGSDGLLLCKKMAPATADAPHSTSTVGLSVRIRAMTTGSAPLSRSPVTTTAAHLRPRARSAFVPPVRPEPTVRGSVPWANRATMTPTGIEPARYETSISAMVWSTCAWSIDWLPVGSRCPDGPGLPKVGV